MPPVRNPRQVPPCFIFPSENHAPIKKIYERIRFKEAQIEEKTNSKRKDFEFHIVNKVYIKSTRTLKLQPGFDGPFTITSISHDKTKLKVRDEWISKWCNTKNIKVPGRLRGRKMSL